MKASVLTTDEVGLSRIQEGIEIKEPTLEKSSQDEQTERRGDRERREVVRQTWQKGLEYGVRAQGLYIGPARGAKLLTNNSMIE